ncbi:monocarboxylate transporter 5 isoform X1 [Nomia melanderi]|uniref:monocarboxylate transporter 5 isoform X1 n=1 Tax=Nomia melanderi TaxID=2448451 RepID=UPI00130473E7|nr:monocarboxylate transporter 13 isoform X2 [Nomia melanderi]
MAHAAVGSSNETNKRKKKSTSENVACEPMDQTGKDTAQHPLPPDGGWGYAVVLASFLIHVITDGMTYSFGVFYLEFLYYFEEGKGATAWIASILVGVTLCSGPISGSFVNKFGCRAVTIAGSILASACLLASMWARNIITLYFTIGIGTGFGFGLIYLPAIVSVSCYFEKYRSLATGIAVCGSGLGTLIFAPCLEYLIAIYGWRGTIMLCSGIVLNCVILGSLFRPLEAKKLQKRSSPEDASQINIVNENSKSQVVTFQKENNRVGVVSTISQPTLILKDGLHEESLRDTKNKIPDLTQMYTEERVYIRGSLPNSVEYATDNIEIKGNCEEKISNLQEILDISIFKDPVFVLFTFSNFCTSIGFNIPYVYILPQAEEHGINKKDASYLLAIIGIANTVGRIVLGYISDKPWVNRLLTYNLCLTICGLSTILSTECTSFATFAIYSFIFGFTSGAYVGLTSVLLVDLLGLHRLTNTFGLLLLFQGFASLLGPPIAGCLYDALETYNPGFFTAGAMITISGLILFFIPLIKKKVQRNVSSKRKRNIINNETA